MMDGSSSYEWPGWSLSENPFGKEFDLDARKRMFKGSRALLPLIEKYKETLGQQILEVGPFFIPLITKDDFPSKKIVYWENDPHVVEWLREKEGVQVEDVDLNKLVLSKEPETEFDAVVASEILNYIDYRSFIAYIQNQLRPQGFLFINNVIEYGLPPLFSQKRPRSIDEIRNTLIEAGFGIVEEDLTPSENPESQNEPRLLIVAQKQIK